MHRPYTASQRFIRGAQHPSDFVMNEFDDLLTRTDGLELQRADRLLAYAIDKPTRHFEAHVRLEQVPADFAQRVGDIALRQHPPASETIQYAGQLIGKGRKHKRSKLNGEYP